MCPIKSFWKEHPCALPFFVVVDDNLYHSDQILRNVLIVDSWHRYCIAAADGKFKEALRNGGPLWNNLVWHHKQIRPSTLPRACCFTNQGARQWCFCSCTGLAKQNLARCLPRRRLPALQWGQPQPGRTESGEGAGFICPCKRVAVQRGQALPHIYNFRISSLKHCSLSSIPPAAVWLLAKQELVVVLPQELLGSRGSAPRCCLGTTRKIWPWTLQGSVAKGLRAGPSVSCLLCSEEQPLEGETKCLAMQPGRSLCSQRDPKPKSWHPGQLCCLERVLVEALSYLSPSRKQ